MSEQTLYPHVSVDCVVLGFDGFSFNVLLLKRTGMEGGSEFSDLKLPGSLLFSNEDLDEAAQRVVDELTDSRSIFLRQFKSFGSPYRTSHPRDVHWLESAVQLKIGRIITVGYLALIRIDDKVRFKSTTMEVTWIPVKKVGKLAFDHNLVLDVAMEEVRRCVAMDPSIVFNLLPHRFTASQMRTLFEDLFNQNMDVRNFHKKMKSMEYVVPLDEYEQQVSHRAGRFYRFDKKQFQKVHGGFQAKRSTII